MKGKGEPKIKHLPYKKAFFCALLFAALVVVISTLSHQPGQESYNLTYAVQQELQASGLHKLTPDMNFMHYDSYRSLRKWAHIYLFAMLGLSAAGVGRGLRGYKADRTLSRPLFREWLLPLAACIGFACLDEWHQSFVVGREGCLRDVCFDSVGILLGVAAAGALSWLLARLTRKNQKQ